MMWPHTSHKIVDVKNDFEWVAVVNITIPSCDASFIPPLHNKRKHKMRRGRAQSFDEINERAASGRLQGILAECNASIGGCSLGKGFQRVARHYLDDQQQQHGGVCDGLPTDDSFYVVDIGILVSQVYQCK